ncbi:unnamed protein product [[Candida] boidinii]|uniref:Unnamed protein product n=1 Tax=Candida boidinii TaxID=5477 RepID=A0A9W6SW19_CANBO|nr:unnamed protein product [[Candida] boidinii]GMF02366.1 unnamed protein product [[Candida] boidinii]GMF99743.1 unnamed protein product [[Candida] boidinii]
MFEMTALNSNMNNENLRIYDNSANTSKDTIDEKRLRRIYRTVPKTVNERKSNILINKTENVVNESEPTFTIEDSDDTYPDWTGSYPFAENNSLGDQLEEKQENVNGTTTGFNSNDRTLPTTLTRLKSKASAIVTPEEDLNEFDSEYSTLISVDFKPRGSKILKDGIPLNLTCIDHAVKRTVVTGAVAPLRDVPEVESDFPSQEASLLKIIDDDLNIIKNEGREKLEYRNSNVFSRLSNNRTSGADFESIRRLIKLSNEDLFNMEYFLLSDADFDLMRSTMKILNRSTRY